MNEEKRARIMSWGISLLVHALALVAAASAGTVPAGAAATSTGHSGCSVTAGIRAAAGRIRAGWCRADCSGAR
ncbi:MAG: hypothetical protein LKE51_06730 [Selenomonas sp.]|nr:hypothetical protein [Selenomonas sp.]